MVTRRLTGALEMPESTEGAVLDSRLPEPNDSSGGKAIVAPATRRNNRRVNFIVLIEQH